MEITLLKEALSVREVLSRKQTEIALESDIIVPDAKPDIGKILQTDGRARITACQVQGDRILISGLADFCILYVPEGGDAMVESVEIQLPFKDVYTEAAAEGAEVQAQAELLQPDATMLNSRKLSVRGMASLHLCISRRREEMLSVGAEGEVQPETKKKTVRVSGAAASGVFPVSAAATEEVPVENPPIARILRTDARIFEEDIKLITGKMIIKGVVRLETLYTADTPSMQPVYMEHAIPFTEILDLPGTEEGMAYTLDYNINDIYCEVDRDEGDGRRFGAEVAMEISAETMRDEEMEILDDCYCPGKKTEIAREAVLLETVADTLRESIAVRKNLELPEEEAAISAVCTVTARPTVTSVSMEGGKVQVEGQVETALLYMTEEGPYTVESWTDRIPFAFSTKTTAPEKAEIACRVRLLDVGYTLPDARTADVRINLAFDLRFTEKGTVENVTEIAAMEEDGEKRPSVVIAFVAPGDSLWSIGKKYGVSADRIAAANGLEADAVLREGMRLLVP